MRLVTSRNQMNGIYRYPRYRKIVACASNLGRDVDRVRELDDRLKDPAYGNDGISGDLIMSQASMEIIAADVATLVETPIDTRDPRVWLFLRDAMIAANQVINVPNFSGPENTSVYEAVTGVCLLFDICARLADRECRAHALPKDGRERDQRIASLYVDIVVGRISAWLSYIDDLGAEAAALTGKTWFKLRDGVASARAQEITHRFLPAANNDQNEAGRLWVNEIISEANQFDTRQYQGMLEDFPGRYVVTVENDEVASALYSDVFFEVMDSLVLPERPVVGLAGWCRTWRVSPVECVSNLPIAVAERIRDLYSKQRGTWIASHNGYSSNVNV